MSPSNRLRRQDNSQNYRNNEDEWKSYREVNDPRSGKRVENQVHS